MITFPTPKVNMMSGESRQSDRKQENYNFVVQICTTINSRKMKKRYRKQLNLIWLSVFMAFLHAKTKAIWLLSLF